MSETRRVVVTGMGAVTPLGNNAADTWEGLKTGRNGIAPITLFDTEKYKAKVGAEVKGLSLQTIWTSMTFFAPIDMPSLQWLPHSRP